MRLIFSTVLAAALVFGGTLLFAGYFGSIEVRDEQAIKDASRSPDDRTVWYCPSVEQIMANGLSDIFVTTPGMLAQFREEFEWYELELFSTYDVTEQSAKGQPECRYHRQISEWKYQALSIDLVTSLRAEIDLASDVNNLWFGTEASHIGYVFSCEESRSDCGFRVVSAE